MKTIPSFPLVARPAALALLVLCLGGGCLATPASTPDRSTSTRPDRSLDRGFSSTGVPPEAPGGSDPLQGESAAPGFGGRPSPVETLGGVR